jgi:putative peptidoglycan lipid II flippase
MNLLKTLATVSSMTLLSRILGFVRDFVIARTFGAGMLTDAFFVAFKLPNLLRRLFAEGAFSQAFVPVLGEYRNKRGQMKKPGNSSIASPACFFSSSWRSPCSAWQAAPLLVYLSAPGFSRRPGKVRPDRHPDAHHLPLHSLHVAGCTGRRRAQYLEPLCRSGFHAGAAQRLVHSHGALCRAALRAAGHGAGWAVFIGGALQLAFQIPSLKRIGMLPRFSLQLRDEGVRRIFRLMAPAVLGVSVAQVSLLLNTIFASFLATGSVSWLYYADRLMEFPAGLLGAALGTILLPSLSAMPCRRRTRRILAAARLGTAPDLPARRAGSAGAGHPRRAADHDAVLPRRVHPHDVFRPATRWSPTASDCLA